MPRLELLDALLAVEVRGPWTIPQIAQRKRLPSPDMDLLVPGP